MPGKDGTGPAGQGAGRGRGRGRNTGPGKGRMGGPYQAGPGGDCVCPKCGAKVPHIVGQPCNTRNCPQCSTKMTRE